MIEEFDIRPGGQIKPDSRARLRQHLDKAIAGRLALIQVARWRATAYLAVGGLLLAVGVIGVAGFGPFAS
jgi:hypothetical protein